MAKAKKSKAKKSKVKKSKASKKSKKPARAAKAKKKVKKSKKPAAKAAKKPAPKKVAKIVAKKAVKKAPKQTVGEGDYAASRAFQKDQAGFVKRNENKIPAMGKEAEAALEGPEGATLRAAEDEARARSRE